MSLAARRATRIADADAVLVYNNEFVIARQGDPVDLDGNGLFDDGVYINVFNNDDSFLTDDGWYFFTATLWDAAHNDLGQAYMAIQVPEPGMREPAGDRRVGVVASPALVALRFDVARVYG